ncbi:hypothetical protein OG898_01285 [Streptomyces sp. NBC_00193]|uniref:hypothetical protein n=1 Tax=Streptomyces sp. NBC_00193 TaxID=2975675 RepID=UPI00225C21F0|nr:hypothetical protein [Streptomyces sp. NBC_00193]MCX5295125.1 hypothetical protein [Streptomyces sp. NBC_00193]
MFRHRVMISAAVVAAAVGFVPVTAQAAPSAGAASATPTPAPKPKPTPAPPAKGPAEGASAAKEAAGKAAAQEIATKTAAAKARASAASGPAARTQQSAYFDVSMGAITSDALSVGLATGVSTDLTYGLVRYDIDWGDGIVATEFGLVADLVYPADHTYAHAGAHTITIKATGPGGETAVTTKTMVVEGSEFTPHAPTRLLDTRDGTGTGTPGARPVGANGTTRVKIAGSGSIPAGVTAVALNITVTNAATAGHVIAYASGTKRPETSNVNFVKGQTVPNLAIVPVGADGYVELANRSLGSVDLIADVTGYFSRTAAAGYTSLEPTRLVDTRQGLGASTVAPGPQKTFGVQVAGAAGLPATGVTAVSLNVTVVNPGQAGHLTVFPGGGQAPSTSSVNFTAGQTVANAVIVPVGPDGRISIRHASFGHSGVIVDVTGYYGADGKAAYLPGKPERLEDTRTYGWPLEAQNYHKEIQWMASGLEALVLNTTVTNTRSAGHLTVAPDPNTKDDYLNGTVERPTPPNTSVLNWTKDTTVANMVQAGTGNNDIVDFWNRGWEPTDLIIDLFGTYSRK